MTINSYGYTGSLGASDWALMARYIGTYGHTSTADYAVTGVAGSRTVSVAAGEAYGHNVRDVSDSAVTVSLPTPTAGQWFLIVVHRDWANSTTTVTSVAGATTSTTAPTAPPTTAPAGRQTGGGNVDDQPLAWVWVNNLSTGVTIFDARIYNRWRVASTGAFPFISGYSNALIASDADLTLYQYSGGSWTPFLDSRYYTEAEIDAKLTDTGWSLTPITLLSGWDTRTDPAGATTSVTGGVRKVGALVSLHFRASRNGGTISGDTHGNFADVNVATLAAGYRPPSVRYITWAQPGAASGQARVAADGTVTVTTVNNGASLANNTIVQFDAIFFV